MGKEKIMQEHSGEGDNIAGDKYEINHIDLDIGILRNILETNPVVIKESLLSIKGNIINDFSPDDRTIAISEKNIINGLEEFYENFIKRVEQKLAALDKFFKDNDYIDEIEDAADAIKMMIFSYGNRNSFKLDSMLFNTIVQAHTKEIENVNLKNVMRLVIFYLYRYCYIGLKNV